MSKITIPLTPQTYAYVQEWGYREPEILKSLRDYNDTLPGHHMRIAPEIGQFLSFLIHLKKVKQVLELGTFRGYSTLWMALALPEDGSLITCDLDSHAYQTACPFWREAGVLSKIKFHEGPALATLNTLQDQGCFFDLIFIDADKKNYPEYYQRSLSLLSPEGMIAIDNTLGYQGAYLPQATSPAARSIDELNRTIYQDSTLIFSMLPIGDGVTLIMKKP